MGVFASYAHAQWESDVFTTFPVFYKQNVNQNVGVSSDARVMVDDKKTDYNTRARAHKVQNLFMMIYVMKETVVQIVIPS